jgi:shikimate dehydrogenase
MQDHYAVMGNPIAHSKSPLIHAQFAQQTGQTLNYDTCLADKDGFKTAVKSLQNNGIKGLNVTVPFKIDAWHYADELSDLARRAEAVNTLIFQNNGTVLGANTDGIGIVRDLKQNHAIALKNQRILVLGAGGAVQGVLQPLLAENPAVLHIANRTASKAIQLAQNFTDLGHITGGGLESIGTAQFDLIINGTAASLQGSVPNIPTHCLSTQASCYDMMYALKDTPFVTWAKQQGALNALDGLGMLVEQAAESFYLWRGIRPNTAPVLDYMKNLGNKQ